MVSEIHQLDFLRDRIHEIRSALFSNISDEAFKLPTCIISALNIDSEGQVCFFIRRPEFYMEERDRKFPARLDFFKKGKPFFLKITGHAQLISDPAEMLDCMGLPDHVRFPSLEKLLLVKVKMEDSQYFEAKPRQQSINWSAWWTQLKYYFSRSRPQPRTEQSYGLHAV